MFSRLVEKSHLKFPDNSPKTSYIQCGLCSYRSSDLAQHPSIHNLSQEEYRSQYGAIKCQNLCDKLSGTNNPGYKHGGKLSPFSKNFVNFTSEEDIDTLKKKSVKTKIANNNVPTTIEYFISRGFVPEEAKELLKKRQTTFSLEKCIAKYGEELGTLRWTERQTKWLSNFKGINYSKISQELFDAIMKEYSGSNVHYATLNRKEGDTSNKELRLRLSDNSIVMPDFICLDKKRIIEFDGDYWHSEKVANPLKEANRDKRIVESGYECLHIKEYEFKKNKREIIDRCLSFLTK